MLYNPQPPLIEKYEKFYRRLSQLTDKSSNILNFIVDTTDRVSLDAIYIKNPSATKCIIFFHGNSGNLAMRYDMVKFLYNYASVVVFDYQSYGKSTSKSRLLSDDSLHNDSFAIWNYATKILKINPNDISLIGESLGCSVVVRLAAELSRQLDRHYYPHSIILMSPFYSLSDMIEHNFSKFNIDFVGKCLSCAIGNEYQTNKYIKFINPSIKIIIAHSSRDEIVPYRQGLKLFNEISQIRPNVQFITLGGTHNNLSLTDQYIYTLAELFN